MSSPTVSCRYPPAFNTDDVAAEPIPSQSAEEKTAEILNDLNAGECICRNVGLHDPAEFHFRSVDDSNRPARRNDVRLVKKWTHHPLQSIALDQRIRIHRADQLSAREAETNVQRVRLAAVLLVYDDERRIGR